MLKWIFLKLFLLGFSVIFVVIVISILVVNGFGIGNVGAQIAVERLLSSSDCLAYCNEDIGKCYSNIIDLDKFKAEKLEKCIDYGAKNKVSAKLTLKNFDEDDDPVTITHEEDDYKKWEPFSFDKTYYLKINKQRYVLIKDNDKTQRGRLQMEVITRVS